MQNIHPRACKNRGGTTKYRVVGWRSWWRCGGSGAWPRGGLWAVDLIWIRDSSGRSCRTFEKEPQVLRLRLASSAKMTWRIEVRGIPGLRSETWGTPVRGEPESGGSFLRGLKLSNRCAPSGRQGESSHQVLLAFDLDR